MTEPRDNSIRCPACGKVLTPETNDEACPKSLYWHGKHPIWVIVANPLPWENWLNA